MSEQEPSGDPGATEPRNRKAEAKAAKAYAKAERPWYKKKRWWLAGFIVLVIVAAAAGGSGSKDTSNTSSDNGSANGSAKSSASGTQTTAAADSKSSSTPASGGTDKLPIVDGDWRLDSIRVQSSLGDFGGTARVTYTGSDPAGGTNLFTVTLFVDGKDVATLDGSANAVQPGDAVSVEFISTDPFVGGPYTYDFQNSL